MYFKKSPCIGVCEIGPASPLCQGCMRDSDDLSVWKTLSFEEKKVRWMQVGARRSTFPGTSIIRDQLRRLVPIQSPIRRIISLVPSLTQTLYALDLGPQIVGTTVFCPPPPEGQPTSIGGTKKLNLSRIRALKPDLIIANKEENIQRDIEILSAEFPVWISDVSTVDEALNMVWLLGEYLDRQTQALALVDGIMALLPSTELAATSTPKSFVYFIWRKPWMTAGEGTFIHAWLQRFGLHNVCGDRSRYPEVDLEAIKALKPELVLLPDEPYPFSEKDREELRAHFPTSKILLVDGKYCSWYGSVMREAIPYLKELFT